jgi:hypothetical protein
METENPKVKAGKLGGASKSKAKVDAARRNGAKGGRPKKELQND